MYKKFSVGSAMPVIFSMVFIGCASNNDLHSSVDFENKKRVLLSPSYLESEVTAGNESAKLSDQDEKIIKGPKANGDEKMSAPSIETLKTIPWPLAATRNISVLSDRFQTDGQLKMAVDAMPVKDFVHYVFGELLSVNYVLGEELTAKSDEPEYITLNLKDAVSPRELFTLVSELLSEREIDIRFGNATYYVHNRNEGAAKPEVVIAIGGKPSDVPSTVKTIQQVVPLQYGVKISSERILRNLIDAKITPDFDQSVIFIEGDRKNILRALELIDLLDTPATRSKFVGLINLSFLTPDNFMRDVSVLLNNEGIDASIGFPDRKNVVMVPLQQIGGVAVFAVSDLLLRRVEYWASVIDVPAQGSNLQYFLYHPKYSRAEDLGGSISALMGIDSSGKAATFDSRGSGEGRTTGNAPSSSRIVGAMTDNFNMVVDERANALVFYTSGSQYRGLMPLLVKLDTMPKQVQLDMTIAEVSLKDEFKYGFEWALSQSEVTVITQGAFGVSGIGGLGVIIDGNKGPLNANFLNSNNLVNVLSNPTVLVRDGISATINVGSEISVVGSTTQDPISGERQTTNSEYRQTGVDVSVTPTVSAGGIVSMEISQNISNSLPNSLGAGGNPDIFTRSISTEVLAESGQTVMLAGLISENYSRGGTGTPWASKIPLFGTLFKSQSNSGDRTELIMLITPRVIETLDEWQLIKDDFQKGLSFLKFSPVATPEE